MAVAVDTILMEEPRGFPMAPTVSERQSMVYRTPVLDHAFEANRDPSRTGRGGSFFFFQYHVRATNGAGKIVEKVLYCLRTQGT